MCMYLYGISWVELVSYAMALKQFASYLITPVDFYTNKCVCFDSMNNMKLIKRMVSTCHPYNHVKLNGDCETRN